MLSMMEREVDALCAREKMSILMETYLVIDEPPFILIFKWEV